MSITRFFGPAKADLKGFGHYNGSGSFAESELRYAELARCICGARLAYPEGAGIDGYWDCADILTGAAVPSGQDGSVKHVGQMPFRFYEIKPERK